MKMMTLFTILAAMLFLAGGCGKQKDPDVLKPPSLGDTEQPAVPAAPTAAIPDIQKSAETLAQDARDAVEKQVETAQEAVKTYTAKAEEALTEISKQEIVQDAKETVQAYTAKAEDILSELSEPVAAVKEKIAIYAQPELIARAEKYKQLILEKKEQITTLAEKLKGLPMTELLGENGKALKEQISVYTEQLTALKERSSLYIEKLKSMGVTL